MDRDRTELILHVEGMTCGGCAAAVRTIILRLDPEAEVAVERDRGRVTATTSARSLDIVRALGEADFTARAMTG